MDCGSPLFSSTNNARKGPHCSMAGKRKNDFRFKVIKEHKFDKAAYDEKMRSAFERDEIEKKSRALAI